MQLTMLQIVKDISLYNDLKKLLKVWQLIYIFFHWGPRVILDNFWKEKVELTSCCIK